MGSGGCCCSELSCLKICIVSNKFRRLELDPGMQTDNSVFIRLHSPHTLSTCRNNPFKILNRFVTYEPFIKNFSGLLFVPSKFSNACYLVLLAPEILKNFVPWHDVDITKEGKHYRTDMTNRSLFIVHSR